MGYKTETHTPRQQCGGHQREGGSGFKGKGAKYMVTEDDLTLESGHTMQYTDHVSQKCTLETYVILLINITPINVI